MERIKTTTLSSSLSFPSLHFCQSSKTKLLISWKWLRLCVALWRVKVKIILLKNKYLKFMLFPKGGGHRRQLVPVDDMNIRTWTCNTLKIYSSLNSQNIWRTLKLNNQTPNNLTEKQARDLNWYFSKDDIQMPTSI